MAKHYVINDIYRSLQGEGMRTGTANVFVRFTGCNLRCDQKPGPKSPGGFQCDTEFTSGRKLSMAEVLNWIQVVDSPDPCGWIIFTGGEPGLQLDRDLIDGCMRAGYKLAIETNGSVELPDGLDWITVSPKVAEHCIRQRRASEVKYVRRYGQAIPNTVVVADHYLISPAFQGNDMDQRSLEWCQQLVKDHPQWKLSVQQHKLWQIH